MGELRTTTVGERIPLKGSIAGEVLSTGRPRRVSQGDGNVPLLEEMAQADTGLVVPLTFRGREVAGPLVERLLATVDDRRTSASHPIRVDWVDLSSVPGLAAKDVSFDLAAVVKDLKSRGLWIDTLVVCGSEFGRTPVREVGGGGERIRRGRDHRAQHADRHRAVVLAHEQRVQQLQPDPPAVEPTGAAEQRRVDGAFGDFD